MKYLWALLVVVGCLGRGDDDEMRDPCAAAIPCANSATITAHVALTNDQLEGATITVCEGGLCSSVVYRAAACPYGQCALAGDFSSTVQVSNPGEVNVFASPAHTNMDETWSVEIVDATNTTLFTASATGSYVENAGLCGTCHVLTLDLQ